MSHVDAVPLKIILKGTVFVCIWQINAEEGVLTSVGNSEVTQLYTSVKVVHICPLL